MRLSLERYPSQLVLAFNGRSTPVRWAGREGGPLEGCLYPSVPPLAALRAARLQVRSMKPPLERASHMKIPAMVAVG